MLFRSERDFKIVSLPPTTHLQTRTPNQLMLPPGHPRVTVIQVLPQSKMWQDAKKSFAQMNVNGNLQNRIGIQMGQVEAIEIKEAAEEGRNGESLTFSTSYPSGSFPRGSFVLGGFVMGSLFQ